MTLDELRLVRLEREINDTVFITLCGSLQSTYGGVWVEPGNDYRGIFGLQVIVVYLEQQWDRAGDVICEAWRHHPFEGSIHWWCLDWGKTGSMYRNGKGLSQGIFMDNRVSEVAQGLAS